VLQVFLNVTIYGMRIGEAVAAPRFHHQAWPDRILFEEGRASVDLLSTLNQLGHATRAQDSIGDVHALMFQDGKIYAAADSRRGGLAGGF
jgi:gamma-glutamyltranspeptidase / glutathione hydrolase